MIKLFLSFIAVLFFIVQISPPAFSEDCSINDEGICQEGECRLDDNQIGTCSSTTDGCTCIPK